jgi:hypothetical protein
LQQNDSLMAAIGWIAQLRVRATTIGSTSLMAILIFLVALALCLDLGPLSPSDPFVAFYFALVVITLACGWRWAAAAALVAAAAGWFFFLRAPVIAAQASPSATASVVALTNFALLALLAIVLSEALAGAAALLTGGANPTNDPRLAALHRRARVAVKFVALPAIEFVADGTALAAVRDRAEIFERLENGVLAHLANPMEWPERMEAFCQARLPRDRPVRPVCRISGDARALTPDRLLGLSLAIAQMLHETLAAGGSAFEVALRNNGAGGCTVEVHTSGVRATRWADAGATPWADVTQWLARLLDATLTVTTDGDLGVRFDFLD